MNKLKVLLACIPAPGTRFLEDWKESLAESCDVTHDHEKFWSGNTPFDVIHIHWPEYLSFEIEAALKSTLAPELLDRLEARLLFWKEQRAVIVVHRHNVFPHSYQDRQFEDLYQLVYSQADAVVHMGSASLRDYVERYRSAFNIQKQVNQIIPHANFASYPNNVTRAEARRRLGIRKNSSTVLVVGGVNPNEERDLVLSAFASLKMANKALVVPCWPEKLLKTRNIRWKYFVRNMLRRYYALHPWFRFGYSFVPAEDLQIYLNAADVLLVQRTNPLNSSNLVLGFTFGRVVVGPDEGNVGEILRETGNPTFEPGNTKSVSGAIQRGLELARAGHGELNQRHAVHEWDLKKTGLQFIELYRSLQLVLRK